MVRDYFSEKMISDYFAFFTIALVTNTLIMNVEKCRFLPKLSEDDKFNLNC